MIRVSNYKWSVGAGVRVPAMAALLCLGGVLAAACGNSPASTASGGASTNSPAAASGSCTGIAGAHHARVVVELSSSNVVARCVGFSGKDIPALKLLDKSHVGLGTQTFSFGVAICQVDHVPAHYSQCLPSGARYWALFLSKNGHTWTSPPVGVSDVTVTPGGSLGLRYDPPTGKPAPPPHPTPAT